MPPAEELRAPSAAAGCPSTWCPRPSWSSTTLPLHPQRQARPPGAAGPRTAPAPAEAGLRARRAPSWSSRWPGSGRSCWASTGSAATTTSSTSAATRCWPPASSPGCAARSASSCRCAPCSRSRRWRASPPRGAAARGAGPRRRRRCRAAGRRPAALLRPAAALVPRPACARQRRSTTCRRACASRGRAATPRSLAAALGEIVRRHEVLRTIFRARARRAGAGDRCRRVPASCRVVDLRGAAGGGARGRGGAGSRREEAHRPFDLARGPAVRAALLRLAERGAPAAARHAPHRLRRLVDRRAGPRAVRALRRCSRRRGLAAARAAGPVRRLRPLAAALARRRGARGASSPTGASSSPARRALELPADRPRPRGAELPRRGAARGLRSPPDSSRTCERSARREGATLFMTLLAAFQALLHRYTGQDDSRRHPGRRPRPRGDRGADRLLRQHPGAARRPRGRSRLPRAAGAGARDGARGLRPPGPALRAAGRGAAPPSASLAAPPLFQVMFALQNAPRPDARPRPGLAVEPVRPMSGARPSSTSRSPGRATGAGLAGSVEYATDLFDAATIERLLGHFATLLLAGIAADPEAPIARLPLLTGGRARAAPRRLERHGAASRARRRSTSSSRQQVARGRPEAVAAGRPVTSG